MAKAPSNAAQRVRKKVRKNIADGIAHVHASFNNTIITITDRQGNALSWASRHPSLRRSLQKWRVALLWIRASRTWTSRSRAPARVVSPRCVRWPLWVSGSIRSLTSPRSRTTAAARKSAAVSDTSLFQLSPPPQRQVSRAAPMAVWPWQMTKQGISSGTLSWPEGQTFPP